MMSTRRLLAGVMRRRPTGLQIATALAVLGMLYLLALPLAVEVIAALRGPDLPFGLPSARWGIANFTTLYGSGGEILATVVATTVFVVGATAISMVLAFGLAWLVTRTTMPFGKLVAALAIAPFLIPRIVQSDAMLEMLAPKSGVLNQLLRLLPWWSGDRGPIDPFGFGWIVIVQGLTSVPFPLMFLMPIMLNMDGTLEEAGRASGATSWQVFRRVTLPTLWPGTLGIGVLQAILVMGSLEIPLLFGQESGRNILSLRLYNVINDRTGQFPHYGLGAAYGISFLVVTALIFQLYRRSMRNADRAATLTGKGMRVTRYPLGRWRAPVLTFVVAFLIPTIVLPALAIMWSSLTPFALPFTVANFRKFASVDAYGKVLGDTDFWDALGRTFYISAVASVITVAIATIAAFVVARSRRSFASRLLDIVASSSIAVPAVIAGFAGMLFYMVSNKYIHLNGSIWVLILVYSYRIALAYRVVYAAIFQIGRELEESAAASGASRFQTLCRIVVPLILPTVLMSWVAAFLLNAQEFTLAVFLSTPETKPVSVYMFERISPGSGSLYAPNEGAAMAVVFAVVLVLVGVGLRWLAGRWQRGRIRGADRALVPDETSNSTRTPVLAA